MWLFFTNFVLVFHKISSKHAYYKVFTPCPRKISLFGSSSKEGLFLVFNSMLLNSWIMTQKWVANNCSCVTLNHYKSETDSK